MEVKRERDKKGRRIQVLGSMSSERTVDKKGR